MKRKTLPRLVILFLTLALLGSCVPAGTPAPAPESANVTAVPTAEPLPELTLLTPEPETAETAAAALPETPTDTPAASSAPTDTPKPTATVSPVTEDGVYTSRDEVALYIHLFRHLPSNFITKKQAERLGWPGGSLEPYAPGKCIGGGYFGNYEGLLPVKKGREYHECDIDTLGARSRGAKRIVYSNDGLIYYTEDHYETFILLYGEE
ncbi:MAG: hypothetical protein IKQ10_08360 [Oscillospiraceae bacterium]|nr:hypothetical protein [Oscillospiraceae bacterium]